MKPDQAARNIVAAHNGRCLSGEFHTDQKLRNDIASVSNDELAAEIVARFSKRRAKSDPKAEIKLSYEIGIAISDCEHTHEIARPIYVPAPPASPEEAYDKVVRGKPLSDQEEDAIVFKDVFSPFRFGGE